MFLNHPLLILSSGLHINIKTGRVFTLPAATGSYPHKAGIKPD